MGYLVIVLALMITRTGVAGREYLAEEGEPIGGLLLDWALWSLSFVLLANVVY